jgi:hypothetical protein
MPNIGTKTSTVDDAMLTVSRFDPPPGNKNKGGEREEKT